MTASESKQNYQVDRETLDLLTMHIESNKVFKKGKCGLMNIPVKHQSMVLLAFLETEETGACNLSQRHDLKVSRGLKKLWVKMSNGIGVS